ncbi:MAG: helix-turn-helix domain-containing protein [Candidatus Thermoplasmatota archaeon]|nr:helix-turn-helix domain-containing protein [Candidatus Thermoplasmatota archaeon]
MKAFKVIESPEAFKLMADKTRRRVIFLLRAKEMTVSQIAAELGMTPQAIYHHIRKFRDADLVEVAREERIDHFIETYYQATAEVFEFHQGKGSGREYTEQQVRETLESLPMLGFDVRLNDEVIERLVSLQVEKREFGKYAEFHEKAEEIEDLSFWARGMAAGFANLLAMTDEEFETQQRLSREFRDALRSTLVEKTPAKVEAQT